VMKALNRHVERVFAALRTHKHWNAGSWHGIDEERRQRCPL
jgi:hypothetical protein